MDSAQEYTYRTLQQPTGVVQYKERNSRFYGYAFPLPSEEAAGPILDTLRKRHKNPSHVCYAWQLGVESPRYRANDDGEPTHSAGMPIYGQIQAFGLTQVLVAVVRIYGGTKLGVGGLVNAYRTAAKMALESGILVERTLQEEFRLVVPYPDLDKVLRLLKRHGIDISSQVMELRCTLRVAVPKADSAAFPTLFSSLPDVRIEPLS